MKKIKVGIVDSGIDLSNNRLMGFVKKGISVDSSGNLINNFADSVGHGTGIADLITKNISEDFVELYIYKIFTDEIFTNTNIFSNILEIAAKDHLDLLNLSLGTVDLDAKYLLHPYIKKLSDDGIILIAAWNDENYTTWPANFQEVVSIKGTNIEKLDEWIFEQNDKEHFHFRGLPLRLDWIGGRKRFIGGSSFATAICTNNILKAIISGKISVNRSAAINYLKLNAIDEIISDLSASELIPWNYFYLKFKNVGLYPFYKEMHAFIRFRENLHFNISFISDFRLSKNAGKFTNEVLENCNERILINKGLPKDSGGADSLIIGYLNEASEAQKKDLLIEALEYALNNHLNVFTFIPPKDFLEWKKRFKDLGLFLESAIINYDETINILEKIQEKKTFNTPIIGVFGTSSKQGKFTLQLALRYELQKRGLRVGQLGTEHQSGCFGIDYTFPSGYGAQNSLNIPMDFYIPLLRRVFSEMDKGQFDVIIVGAQSGLLNPDYYYYESIRSEIILISSLPDYTILVFNEFDDEELLDRIDNLVKLRTSQSIATKISYENLKVKMKEFVDKFSNQYLTY